MVDQWVLDRSSTLDSAKAKLKIVQFKWLNVVFAVAFAVAMFATLAIAGYCAIKGRELSWQYKFGILMQVNCKK